MPDAALRIIDANLNRAREALRTLEDHARLAWDDRELAARCKAMRHRIAEIGAVVGSTRLLAARDIEHDVGRDTRVSGETERRDAERIIGSACGRLSEALRVIAEYAKLAVIGAADAVSIADRLRYESYALQAAFELRGGGRAALKAAGLYVIVTEALCRGDWRETAAQTLAGGAKVVQLREKALSDRELLDRARWLCERTRAAGALLFINDRPDIARLSDADGVHIGQDDLRIADARRAGGGRLLIGVSTHTCAQIDAAITENPDYVAVGPMFPTATKPQAHIAGLETLRYARSVWEGPLVAIGGIAAASAHAVRGAGADVVCVCSAVISSAAPADTAKAILQAL